MIPTMSLVALLLIISLINCSHPRLKEKLVITTLLWVVIVALAPYQEGTTVNWINIGILLACALSYSVYWLAVLGKYGSQIKQITWFIPVLSLVAFLSTTGALIAIHPNGRAFTVALLVNMGLFQLSFPIYRLMKERNASWSAKERVSPPVNTLEEEFKRAKESSKELR